MKKRYLDLMERVVSAYTTEHIDRYIDKIKEHGVKEHGFPRLTANLGILMAHGRLLHLKDRFETMMQLCCASMPEPPEPGKNRGNDFSVREILLCILEVERSGLFPKEVTDCWRAGMAKIEPCTCYRTISPDPPRRVDNWAAFNAAGEQLRKKMGLADEGDFIDNQIASQLLSFDENGMYRDPNEPMVYDLVPRLQLANLLHFGYDGIHKTAMEQMLEKGGKCTLPMQSVTGEIPFGGRSNQFLHNEATLAAVCEYEAVRYKKRGDLRLAGQFRRAAECAVANIEMWLSENGMFHVKNRMPVDDPGTNRYAGVKKPPLYGCEKYAYYDKYMVTTASCLYNAYLFCDESIEAVPAEERSYVFQTGSHFHKVFAGCGGYFLEFEKDADPEYDASGLGRIHKRGAPGPICLSVPVSQEPHYGLDVPNPCPMALAPMKGEELALRYELTEKNVTKDAVSTRWNCVFADGGTAQMTVSVSEHGVDITTDAESFLLPAFDFDGAEHTEILAKENALSVLWRGWECRYEADTITDTGLVCGNRNGKYRLHRTPAKKIHIEIKKGHS